MSEKIETDYQRCGNCDLWRLREIIDGKWDWACPQSPDKDQNDQACNRWQPTYELVDEVPGPTNPDIAKQLKDMEAS